jgi:ABC-type bacteriocin/lantibiotic exporter with double-glycine peptidase domain
MCILSYKLAIRCVCSVAFCCSIAVTSAFSREKSDALTANYGICGPRCVRYVLEYYGQNTDFVSVVNAVQPIRKDGASLAAIATELEEKQIHTAAFYTDPSAMVINWAEPVIVHFHPKDKEQLGHFVVWLPQSTDGRYMVWDGLNGVQQMELADFREATSGFILLTSHHVIDPSKMHDVKRLGFFISIDLILAATGMCLLFAFILFAVRHIRSRQQVFSRLPAPKRNVSK